MDELTKHRVTGAIIWLSLLIILVPSWYASPVDFSEMKDIFSLQGLTADEKTMQTQGLAGHAAEHQRASKQQSAHKESDKVGTEPSLVSNGFNQVNPTGQWLVRVASYGNIQSAHRVFNQLEGRYQVTIGDFSNQERRLYSLRVGPFDSLSAAELAKKELDAEFSVDALIVKVR
ncbi:SPOR domain-containing protein [Thiomicrospira sp. R3]|uniref:SPOR domain-containing protein n=1 Tax=Thiomicrospira sp. R3 TaxID=3035472 RepID=UPI00259B01C1|nr:SPOR domain-containing protein [Thiomicrospira sp. R3]WFE68063.1 SPOR domain-containing protein [Thiomicrospira sp. R3]